MTDTRLKRRIVGVLSKRLREAGLDDVEDPRDQRGRRWKLGTLLGAAVLGLVAGCKSLLEVEALTEDLSPAARQRFGLERRVPDTTLHNLLWQLQPPQVLPVMHRVVRAAHRRHALDSDELPFGVVSLDGKNTAVPTCDDYYAQRQTHEQGHCLGMVRTISAVLVSCPARPYLHVTPVPASTNEMGIFTRAFDELMSVYRRADLFRVVVYDAGACSKDNAAHVRDHGLHYVFGLKGTQPTLLDEAQRLLAERTAEQCDAWTEDLDHGTIIRRVYLSEIGSGYDGWESLRTVVRVQTETRDAAGRVIKCEERYFISSLPLRRLTPAQWLLLIRRHWRVETAHQILDTAFDEDAHPWIVACPRATVVVAILRRMAYTLVSLFRSVTQRSTEARAMPWKRLLRHVSNTLVSATAEQLHRLRRHRLAPLPT
jgi:hypothetical protein